MRKLTLLALLALFCCFSLTALAQKGTMAVPPGIDLEKYPLFDRPLSTKEMAKFGLRPVRLTAPLTVHNWFKGTKRFALETLPVNTLILVDATGLPVYKADCGNRIGLLPPPTPPTPAAGTGTPARQSAPRPPAREKVIVIIRDRVVVVPQPMVAITPQVEMARVPIIIGGVTVGWGIAPRGRDFDRYYGRPNYYGYPGHSDPRRPIAPHRIRTF